MDNDKPLGAGLIAFGIVGIIHTLQISVRTFNDDPGPKLFPIIAFSILILCGIGMIATRAKGREAAGLTPEERRARLLRGTVMAALFVGYSLLLWLVGFYVATPVAVYALYHVIAGPGRRVVWRGAVYALAVTGGVHLVFVTFLNSFMPQGMLF